MKKVYYLSSCDTCKRILKEMNANEDFELQDIKNDRITELQLGEMKSLSGSYESLFSRVARKYKELGLKDRNLCEEDYKKYILEEYTFLKRPVFLVEDKIFIGNSKKNTQSLAKYIQISRAFK